MEINALRIAVTVVSFVAFLCIVAWALNAGNRKRFEEAARLPLDDHE